VVLADELDVDEPVLDLAFATDTPATLVAVCPSRVVLVAPQSLRARTDATSIDYSDVADVVADGDELKLATRTGDEPPTLRNLAPFGAAPIIAGRIAARTESRSDPA
jgi:hypothetical protein